jgi:hypothetical protein
MGPMEKNMNWHLLVAAVIGALVLVMTMLHTSSAP